MAFNLACIDDVGKSSQDLGNGIRYALQLDAILRVVTGIVVTARRPEHQLCEEHVGSMGRRRIIQWATGTVGRHAVAAVAAHPDLELVGAYVYSDTKVGRDIGEICGIDDTGVVATNSIDDVLALDADCVLYMAQGEMDPFGAVDNICRLLASGKNVVSTAVTALIYPQSLGAGVVDRLAAACAEGGTSFHATGIEPGWAAEVVPLTMSGLCRKVDSILVQELLDYGEYDSPSMLFDIMGFGKRPLDQVPMSDPAVAGSSFRASLMLLADGLGATIDDFTFDRQVAVTEEAFEVKAGSIGAGTVSAQRFSCTAVVDGRPALTVEHITRLRDDQAPDWPSGRGWKVIVEGTPSLVLEAQIATGGEDENDQACLGTAMHAVHAIEPVCAAAPGIRTFLDLPTIIGKHVLASTEN